MLSQLSEKEVEGVEKKLAADVATPYKSAKTFKELGLSDNLLEVGGSVFLFPFFFFQRCWVPTRNETIVSDLICSPLASSNLPSLRASST